MEQQRIDIDPLAPKGIAFVAANSSSIFVNHELIVVDDRGDCEYRCVSKNDLEVDGDSLASLEERASHQKQFFEALWSG